MGIKHNQHGFTLPELLALIAIGFILLGVSFMLLHTDDRSSEELNNKRRLQLALLAQTIHRYEYETGKPLDNLPEKPAIISSEKNGYDLCKILVPKYVSDLPYDPQLGTKLLRSEAQVATVPCSAEGVAYVTGYLINRDKQGRVVLRSVIPDSNLKVML